MSKKIYKSILVSLLATFTTLVVTSCGEKHEFSNEWTHDETAHWHTCLTEGHTDTIDNAEHEFSDWAEKTPAGLHADKVEFRTCIVCKFEEVRTIANTALHNFSTEWSFDSHSHWHSCIVDECDTKNDVASHVLTVVDEVPATCLTTGVAKHQICECGALFDLDGNLVDDISHFTLSIDSNKHNFSEWISQVDASCKNKTNGVKGHYDCLDCNKHFDAGKKELTDLTIAWAHTQTPEIRYSNNSYHVHYCSGCGYISYDGWREPHTSDNVWHTNTMYPNLHYKLCTVCNHSFDTAQHTYGDPVVTIEPTYTSVGSQTETCTVCGYEKVSQIPVLNCRQRTPVYTGPNEKVYDGKAITLYGLIDFTTTSDDKTDISIGQAAPKVYTNAECTNFYAYLSDTKEVGEYFIKCEWSASTEKGWDAASIVIPFEIKPIVLATFSPKTKLQVKLSDISSDGVLTLGQDTSVSDQSVKATVKLNNYKGLGNYSFAYSDITISGTDGSSTSDYLKNYVVNNNATSESEKVTVYVYDELVNSFTVKEVVSASTDNSTGKAFTTFTIKPNLSNNTTLCLVIGEKLLMDSANRFATINKISFGVVSCTQVGSTTMIYASQTDVTITLQVLGTYNSTYLVARTFTLHNHDFNANTGACICGNTYAQEIMSEETAVRVSANLQVVDHKAYFNFNRCANLNGSFSIRVHGGETDINPIENIEVHKYDSTNISSFSLTNTSTNNGIYEYDYTFNGSLSLFDANTQYYVIITLKDTCTYSELTCDISAPFHRYQGINECECGATK